MFLSYLSLLRGDANCISQVVVYKDTSADKTNPRDIYTYYCIFNQDPLAWHSVLSFEMLNYKNLDICSLATQGWYSVQYVRVRKKHDFLPQRRGQVLQDCHLLIFVCSCDIASL